MEGDVNYQFNGAPTRFTGAARLGYDFNSPFMLFAKGGLSYDTTNTTSLMLGGGAQYEIYQGTSIRADLDWYQPVGGGATSYVAKIGLNYSF